MTRSTTRNLLTLALGAFALFAAPAAAARCGDRPGDDVAVAAARSLVDQQCPCGSFSKHGDYVRCARDVVVAAVDDGSLPRLCRRTVLKCARKSTCGHPSTYVPCCRTNERGVTRCRIKRSADRCRAPSGGSACVGQVSSCCDSCGNGGTCVTTTPTETPTLTPTPTVTPTRTIPAFCESVVGLPALAEAPFTIGTGTLECGGSGLTSPAPAAPFSGQIDDGSGSKISDLGLGCLYLGAQQPIRIPDGGTAMMSVVGINGLTITLGSSDGTGPTDCTRGAGPGRHCANGFEGTDGQGTCTNDSDCGGPKNTCTLDPNCFFGPPIPLPPTEDAPVPVCLMNAFEYDICGSLDLASITATLSAALSVRVYITIDKHSPCPRCVDGACTAGKRVGEPCTSQGSLGTTNDCPPADHHFLTALSVTVPELTSGTSTLTADAEGAFCPGQSLPGAFALADARTIVQQGSTTPNGLTVDLSTVGTFCVEESGTVLDLLSGLPAAGTLSVTGTIDLSDALLP